MRFAKGLEAGTVGINCTSPGEFLMLIGPAGIWMHQAVANARDSDGHGHAVWWIQVVGVWAGRRASVLAQQLLGDEERADQDGVESGGK